MIRRLTLVVAAALAALVPVDAPLSAESENFPNVIGLPDGFFPEGIAIRNGQTFFTGSLVNGSI